MSFTLAYYYLKTGILNHYAFWEVFTPFFIMDLSFEPKATPNSYSRKQHLTAAAESNT